MEWLAYLIFPVLVLLIWLFYKRLSTGWIIVIWCIVMAPLVAYAFTTGDPYYTANWGSTYRILTEFTAGAITYLIVRRLVPDGSLDPRPRVEKLATTLSAVLPILVIVGAVILGNLPAAQPPQTNLGIDAEPLPPYYHLLLVPLLIIWIGALALSRRGLARTLGTRTLVLGGFISYSLYMTHLVWFGLWRAGMKAVGIDGGALYAVGFVALVVGAILIAWLMWKFVEEPAREWMRTLVGARRKPTEEAGEQIQPLESAEPVIVSEDPAAPGDQGTTRA
jgi:peptidoglycan/LPS O-acetylase OafA/YrhL